LTPGARSWSHSVLVISKTELLGELVGLGAGLLADMGNDHGLVSAGEGYLLARSRQRLRHRMVAEGVLRGPCFSCRFADLQSISRARSAVAISATVQCFR
jgi:hypothetical protein